MANRKQWLMRFLGAMLVGSILMLIAVVIGTAVAIVQAQ